MKKLFLLLIFILSFCSIRLKAQTNIFTTGTSNFNIGLYLPAYISNLISPPLSISYDYGIVDFGQEIGSLGIGGYFGSFVSKIKYPGDPNTGSPFPPNKGWAVFESYFDIAPRINYHFNGIRKVPQLDLYATFIIGLRIMDQSIKYYDNNSQDLFIPHTFFNLIVDLKIGAKYWFKDYFGAFLELGWGSIGACATGVSFKF